MDIKFNPKNLEKLNNPIRLNIIPPVYIWEKLKLLECNTIVDIGAGTGLFSEAFSKLMKNGTVYALDISDVMIKWIQDNVSCKYKEIIPMLMSEKEIPLGDDLSDLVIMITLHHELKDPKAILIEAFRILKKGGKVCIIDWKKEKMSNGPSLEIRCSIDDISSQLEASGFKRIQVDSSLDIFNMVWAEKLSD